MKQEPGFNPQENANQQQEQKRMQAWKKIWQDVSRPYPTFEIEAREQMGEQYESRVVNTDSPEVKHMKRYENDPTPSEVWLDPMGRYIRIVSEDIDETFEYDQEGYLVKYKKNEGAGQGLQREYVYGRDEEKQIKILKKASCTIFEGIGSTETGAAQGKAVDTFDVLFDNEGNPDHPAPLHIYSV